MSTTATHFFLHPSTPAIMSALFEMKKSEDTQDSADCGNKKSSCEHPPTLNAHPSTLRAFESIT
jgi:hypothetical protein